MQAERVILETDADGSLIRPPKLPPNSELEAIFLVLRQQPRARRRAPSAAIAGKGKTLGDIVSPIVPEADWDVLK
jgi:hypothetical protein